MTMLATAGPKVDTGPRWTSRGAAILLVAMACLVCVGCRSPHTPGYALLLACSLTTATVVLASMMWRRHTFRIAIAADTTALLTMITQLLVAMVGSPGATRPDPHWSFTSAGVVVTAFAVLVMLAADAPYEPADPGENEHPYAL